MHAIVIKLLMLNMCIKFHICNTNTFWEILSNFINFLNQGADTVSDMDRNVTWIALPILQIVKLKHKINKVSTHLGESRSSGSSAVGTVPTNSCSDGRSLFGSPSRDRSFLRDLGSVDAWTSCFCKFNFNVNWKTITRQAFCFDNL